MPLVLAIFFDDLFRREMVLAKNMANMMYKMTMMNETPSILPILNSRLRCTINSSCISHEL